MSFQDKLESVRSLVEAHNKVVGEGNPGFVEVEKFFSFLKAFGANTEDHLKGLSHEEILECLEVLGDIKPKILAKDIAKVFRGKEEVPTPVQVVTAVKADRMTPRQLVEAFDPEDHANPVGVRLANLSKNQPFIVFQTGRIVDIDSTFTLLSELKIGYQGRNDYTVSGIIKKVYRLGELPNNYVDENPFFANRPLRPDGTCDQTGRSWEGVPLEVRQLIRIAIGLGELTATIDKAHDVHNIALGANAMTELRTRYRKSSVEFDRLSGLGQLPNLKIALGEGNPNFFQNGAKVVWAEPPSPQSNHYRAIPKEQFVQEIQKIHRVQRDDAWVQKGKWRQGG